MEHETDYVLMRDLYLLRDTNAQLRWRWAKPGSALAAPPEHVLNQVAQSQVCVIWCYSCSASVIVD